MSDRIYAATRKGLFTIEKSGGRWRIARTAFLGDHVSMVLPDAGDGRMVAALEHGHFGVKMQRSSDGGDMWQESAAPVYPEKPADEDKDLAKGMEPNPWKLKTVWALERGGPDRPGVLWCGTIPGGLFVSKDHGATWTLLETLWRNPKRREWFGGGADQPGIHSVCVDPRDSKRVAVAVSCGGVWITPDAGETWECHADGMRAEYMPPDKAHYPNTQDAHRIVQCAAKPEVMWCQHHNGIFRTTDGSKSWQEIKHTNPSVFGFAVAVHPTDADLAWFVPAIKDEKRIPVDGKVVVARTRDGGKSFSILAAGLPQQHAYDITFRHGLDVDSTGRTLAFGSTTGSLWISDDQGDHWQTISEHLPPVYCVRFEK